MARLPLAPVMYVLLLMALAGCTDTNRAARRGEAPDTRPGDRPDGITGDSDGGGSDARIPPDAGPPPEALEVMAGRYHSCARLSDDTVRCWGRNDAGQLGEAPNNEQRCAGEVTVPCRKKPVIVEGLSAGEVVQLAGGGLHTCALLQTGRVLCWGDNTYGQLGDGTTESRHTPRPVPGLEGVTQIALGHNHTCARTDEGAAFCWGSNRFWQIGVGPVAERCQSGEGSLPCQLTPARLALGGVEEVGAGEVHGCARLDDGSVSCWGFTGDGRLGHDDPRTDRLRPGRVEDLPPCDQLSVGRRHACARIGEAALCWGANDFAVLGDDSFVNRITPEVVPGLPAVARVAAGGDHTCALLESAGLWCWGQRYQRAPRAVGLDLPVRQISAGGGHTCVLLEGGQVRCHGLSTYRQLAVFSTQSTLREFVLVEW